MGFSLVAVSRSYSLVVVLGLLIAAVSLVVGTRGSMACRLHWLWHMGSAAVVPGL